MLIVKYLYNKNLYVMNNIQEDCLLCQLLNKYSSLINIKIKHLCFLYNGKILQATDRKKMGEFKKKDILIVVMKKKKKNNNKLSNIICPECKEYSLINIQGNNKIILEQCSNKHQTIFDNLTDFFKSQNIKNEFKCEECGNNLNDYNNKFFFDSSGKKFCVLCIDRKGHNEKLIENNYKLYTCINHGKEYASFCKSCNKNLCTKCENDHIKHKLIYYKQILSKKEANSNLKEIKESLDKFKIQILNLNSLFIDIIEKINNNIKEYYMIHDYYKLIVDNGLFNYSSINNINNLNSKIILKDINQIINDDDLINKFKYLLTIYDNIPKNEMRIKYRMQYYDNWRSKYNIKLKLKIFSQEFVKNNKNNCILLIDDQKFHLQEFCPIKPEKLSLDYNYYKAVEIKLIEKRKISDMSYMFKNCHPYEIYDAIDWNTKNVTDMSYMFYNCFYLKSLPDISKWNIDNVENLSYMFYNCHSLETLPDISKWNIDNVENLSCMFYNCHSLETFPDISKWKTNKVKDLNRMFYGCISLKKFPDISKWNVSNIANLSFLFSDCKSLLELPDISKWDVKNLKDVSGMFYNCKSLKTMPNIENWNAKKIENIYKIFYDCSSLSKLPDISKWKLKNNKIKDEEEIEKQNSLILKDISKLDLKKLNLEERKKIFSKIKEVYPTKIPIIISLKKIPGHSRLLDDDNDKTQRILMEGCFTIGYLANNILKRNKLNKNGTAIHLINGNTYFPFEIYINEAYEKYKNEDGFFYIDVAGSRLFG